jgi:hypothetical protein
VPPLRERTEDIPSFIEHFSAHYAREYGRPQWRPEPHVLAKLITHPWPGNVRQLAQAIQRIYAARSAKALRRSMAVMAFMPLTTALIAVLAGVTAAAHLAGKLDGVSSDGVIGVMMRQVQEQTGQKAQVVPVSPFWGKDPGNEEPSIFKLIFNDDDNMIHRMNSLKFRNLRFSKENILFRIICLIYKAMLKN